MHLRGLEQTLMNHKSEAKTIRKQDINEDLLIKIKGIVNEHCLIHFKETHENDEV